MTTSKKSLADAIHFVAWQKELHPTCQAYIHAWELGWFVEVIYV